MKTLFGKNFFTRFAKKFLPDFSNILWTINSAILLILAFPDFNFWVLAFVALIPFFYALHQESESKAKSFTLGWIWGIAFFFGSCWWLAFPMINYAYIPAPIAYLMVLCVTIIAGIFPAVFALIQSSLVKKIGINAFFLAPFIWVFTEFLRFSITGNNWNDIAYSQAFGLSLVSRFASIGGIWLSSFILILVNTCYGILNIKTVEKIKQKKQFNRNDGYIAIIPQILIIISLFIPFNFPSNRDSKTTIIALQPNVPMSGLQYEDWERLRERHFELSERELKKVKAENPENSTIVVFPESPMNFAYARDREFQEIIGNFAKRNNTKILFNSAEPDSLTGDLYNSAVMIGENGKKIAQYDKIYLLPFGEYVPLPSPLESLMPAMVGKFRFGKEYDILPLGEAKAGVVICFESHFPNHTRKFIQEDADLLIELTNDGYLGPTPVLRQHLANAVYRAIEINRPIVRVTNVGISGYINEIGMVFDETESYIEDTRVWEISKSNGEKTFYVQYGDWFAWLCSIVGLICLAGLFWRKKSEK